jgi:hypothetical protein
MPIRVGWGDAEKTYIYLQLIGHWTWEDYYQAMASCKGLVHEVGRPVGLMANFADSYSLPTNALVHYRRTIERDAAQWRFIVLVSPNPLMMSVMRVLKPLYPQFHRQVAIAATINEAREILRRTVRPHKANT